MPEPVVNLVPFRSPRGRAPSTSVVVTTYNNPRALELVLAGLARQTHPPLEVLVADDGSGPETRGVVRARAAKSPFPVEHLWHPDDGPRKTAILNKAVVAARGEYLVFLDGDCVPPAGMLREHLRHARPGRFVTGGKICLNEAQSARLTEERLCAGELDRIRPWWLGLERAHRAVFGRLPVVKDLLDGIRRGGCSWPGENSSTYKEHVERVNGFDERFTIQWEDQDFGNRLVAAGFVACSIRYRAPVFHLDHGRSYIDAEAVLRNKALMQANLEAGVVATPWGISQAGEGTKARS